MKTAIMGFGNPVRSDDAVGIYVIDQLREKLPKSDDISIFDMGTSAFEVLFGLKGHDKIILADVMKAPQDDPMVFLHGMKWDQALSYTKKILRDEYPKDIQVYLVAIENTKLEVDLSDVVKEAGDKVVQHILEDLNLSIPS